MTQVCFVTCPAGLEKQLLSELQALGCSNLRVRSSGIECAALMADLYRICLCSRVANRVLFPLFASRVTDEKSYYRALHQFAWEQHIEKGKTIAIDFFSADSCITHSRFGAQLSKDAVVDRIREQTGERPSVERYDPDVRINVYLFKNRARVSIDLAGRSLHQRGYRQQGTTAPVRENLAAAILRAADWPLLASKGVPLVDPMCGSGTFVIEAAMVSLSQAPGLLRTRFGFQGWSRYDAALWESIRTHAVDQHAAAMASAIQTDTVRIRAFDIDPVAVAATRENVTAAGLDSVINVEQADFFTAAEPLFDGPGLLIVNPPYGERLQAGDNLPVFYSKFGKVLKRRASGGQLALLTSEPALFHRAGLARRVLLECSNGGIACSVIGSDIPRAGLQPMDAEAPIAELQPAVDALRNRLRKNMQKLAGWAKSANVSNYRIYDTDLPEFAFAVDVYRADRILVSLQEYRAPREIDPVQAHARLLTGARVVSEVTGCAEADLAIKQRAQRKAGEQYQRLQKRDEFHLVREGDCQFSINIHDYLDTGLFLDHRKIRQWIAANVTGKRFLNLYSYTATATVHAAVGGAAGSVSVDLSKRYTEWARRNFHLNAVDESVHHLASADSYDWLQDYRRSGVVPFDVIFLDPPTFSNSARTERDWDVQRDHLSMIDDCMSILSKDGVLVFSTNFRRFELAPECRERYQVHDRSQWSLQRDFSRNRRIHQCWFMSRNK